MKGAGAQRPESHQAPTPSTNEQERFGNPTYRPLEPPSTSGVDHAPVFHVKHSREGVRHVALNQVLPDFQ